MRILLVLLITVLLAPQKLAAQIASDSLTNNILTTKAYRAGLYKTFEEFKTNSPSDTNTHIMVKELTDKERYWSGGLGYSLIVEGTETRKEKPLKGDYWGYCDGSNIFIRQPNNSKRVDVEKIEMLGLYCFYNNHQADASGTLAAGMAFGVVGVIVASAIAVGTPDTGQPCIMNINSGVTSVLTNSIAEKILDKDPELRAEVGPVRHYQGDPKEFIRKYNLRNAHLIKPF